jgi:hypothetical protein
MRPLSWAFVLVLFAAEVASVSPAWSAVTVVVKDKVLREKIKSDAVVEFPAFSITTLKGWSFQGITHEKPTGSDGMTIDFFTTPGSIAKSMVYLGARERESKFTQPERKKMLLEKKGHRIKTVTWNGFNWLLDEYHDKAGKVPMIERVAYLVHSGKEYMLVSAMPVSKRHKYEASMMKVMKSLKFSSQPPHVRTAASHSQ